nr:hypothetical protein [Tanacetum cinerariifolium]
IGPGLGGDPGAGRERGQVVHRVQAEAADEGIGFEVVAQGARRPHAGQQVAPGIARIEGEPLAPGAAQKMQVARRVHALERG